MAASDITAERVRELLHYDQETGIFTRRIACGYRGCKKTGVVVGCLRDDGYVLLGIDGRMYFGHRVAWFWAHGRWPSGDIDHIDGNPSNNRLDNLRDVSRAINSQNQRHARSGNASGLMGATLTKYGTYQARIYVSGKVFRLGTFPTAKAANAAYLAAKRKLQPGFVE